MKLSIVTINYNDAIGLKRTLDSVASQTFAPSPSSHLAASPFELEHIIIDGASTDGSVDVIKEYEKRLMEIGGTLMGIGVNLKWNSEKDKGIYNAMNKGIKMATGDYIQILNSGDILASNTVIQQMSEAIHRLIATSPLSHLATSPSSRLAALPELIYGNMLVDGGEGSFSGSKEVEYSLRQYYSSTLNHDCCWIKRSLFDIYGFYDENLKIVSDWKWWLQAIGLGHVKPIYVDIDMTIFEGGGISSMQLNKRNQERRQVLEELLPPAILADYDKHAFDMQQMDNLRKHPWAYNLVWTLERVLNRIDNKNFRKPKK